jgi:uncharacterized protein (DUF697 family)
MTFAKWETMVRYLNDTLMIWTTVDSTGQVTSAFTAHGQTWQLSKA